MPNAEALLKLVGSPDHCSKRWVWEQYDHLILGNTVQTPGGDAAIVRVEDGPKGLALTTDVTPRYCEADPVEGGKQAVAEAWRNITAVGGLPLAITDNLNFGNPERPEVMGQFVGCLKGIGEACRALDFPVVSGNVSLYNETNGHGILPTPTIGGVGVLDDVTVHATIAFKREGDAIILIGETKGWLGQSIYLRDDLRPRGGRAAAGRSRAASAATAISCASSSAPARSTRVHDCSDGGLAARARRDGDGGRHRRRRSPPCPQDLPAARLPVRRGSGAATCSAPRQRCGRRHPLRGRARWASRRIMLGADRRRHVDSAGRRGHIGGDAEGRARSLAARLHGRQAA